MTTERNTIILLNGPPGSGKDTAAGLLKSHPATEKYVRRIDRMSMPLKRTICSWLNEACDVFGNTRLEATKDEPNPMLLGKSYRQAQINLSTYMKSELGNECFGAMLIRRIYEFEDSLPATTTKPILTLVPDSGFMEETIPVVQWFGFDRVFLVRIHRPGYTFERDSRSYLPDIPMVKSFDVQNDGDIRKFASDLVSTLSSVLGE